MQPGIAPTSIPLLASVDVLIAGAGSAGCCAAIAAARAGTHSVMLIERYGFAGGASTSVLDTFYGFFTPGPDPRKVVGGIADEVVDTLAAANGMYLRPNTYGAGTGVTYNPELLKTVWDRFLTAAGVRVLLHTFICDCVTSTAGEVTAVIVATKRGLFRIDAQRIVDASGDADVCHWAGIPYERAGELEPAQTLTTTFRMSNVDLNRFEQAGGKKRLAELMQQAVESGRHALPRRKGSAHGMAIHGCVATVATRVADVDATDPEALTRAEIEGRRQAFVYEAFFRDMVPGFEHCAIAGLSTQIGVRETRRVYGEYRLTRDDCMTAKQFDDVVLLCGAPIEDHRQGQNGQEETAWAYVPNHATYDVPYRTLVPKGRNEILVAGRCFSAAHDAHASCRSMAQTMAMGQAAGTAAILSLQKDCSVRDIPIAVLQQQLRASGGIMQMPSHKAHTAADAWRLNRSPIKE